MKDWSMDQNGIDDPWKQATDMKETRHKTSIILLHLYETSGLFNNAQGKQEIAYRAWVEMKNKSVNREIFSEWRNILELVLTMML